MNNTQDKPNPIPQEIWYGDFPDTTLERDGYDMKSVPDLSRKNLEFLADKYNELIQYLNERNKN